LNSDHKDNKPSTPPAPFLSNEEAKFSRSGYSSGNSSANSSRPSTAASYASSGFTTSCSSVNSSFRGGLDLSIDLDDCLYLPSLTAETKESPVAARSPFNHHLHLLNRGSHFSSAGSGSGSSGLVSSVPRRNMTSMLPPVPVARTPSPTIRQNNYFPESPKAAQQTTGSVKVHPMDHTAMPSINRPSAGPSNNSTFTSAASGMFRCKSPTDQGSHRYEKPVEIWKRTVATQFQ
jgi:hypothetical protein